MEEIIRINIINLIFVQIKQGAVTFYYSFFFFTGVFEIIESEGKNLVQIFRFANHKLNILEWVLMEAFYA